MQYKTKKYGIDTERVNFQKTESEMAIPDLLKIQTESFQQFLDTGIEEVFQEIYPVESKKLRVEYINSKIELPKDPIAAVKAAKDKGTNYSAKISAEFRIIDVEDGTVKSKDKAQNTAFIANLPLMTDGGSFIINGSERVIISQIVRAPGVYYENMKASKTQTASDASINKLITFIPSRGS